mmetsp:Transcript_7376/g.14764  ORF Transcript_7376/g.14764 Transcript_7376/m.14764 type:complete len:406 (-) Transcript_7376:13-1230(-)|eukprot:CAMPEP_0119085538 /NCGR_PEP_ID=MMETSP1178-20130426/134300_1 /TAXON_ID=33656 /ORGANISM="unid sp, Strain CCMP2000" /LENGTH=405 /DNA_ID=CAMNT_0007068603 /DNA_START=16 /DNA_END=1233 /DNA_ORIENTATION=+
MQSTLLRAALRTPRRAGRLPAASSSLMLCRFSTSPAASTGSYVPRKETRQGASHLSFWERWEKASAGEFHQSVGFDHDKKNDERFRKKMELRRRSAEFDDVDDIDDYDIPMPGPSVGEAAGQQAQAAAYTAAREQLAGDGVNPVRRAELLGLLEDMGAHSFAPVDPMPAEPRYDQDIDDVEVREKYLKSIAQFRTYMGALDARASGQLPAGAYFTYVLHTRRVNKVKGTNKRMSYSVLVVVGNGKGTAGLGMGKDLAANAALMKATHAARKNLVHIDRFEERTIFHDFESEYRGTKAVVVMRRPFSGTCVNWLAWKIFSAFGISDVSCSVYGSMNNINQAHAIVNGLIRMVTPQKVADDRGKRVLDIVSRGGNRIDFPSSNNDIPPWAPQRRKEFADGPRDVGRY